MNFKEMKKAIFKTETQQGGVCIPLQCLRV